jgi:hypothetical protein
MLQEIISQSNTEKLYPITVSETVNDVFRVCDRRSVFPSMLWQDGKTFFGANKNNTTYKNQIILLQYNHNFDEFIYRDVGNGTDTVDDFNHPLTYIWAESGTLYCGQTNVHNDPIDIYKPLLENDYTAGSEQLTSITGDNGYPQAFKTVGSKTAFCVRLYPEGVGNFNLGVQISDSDIEGTFTQTLITENTVGYRHYNVVPIIYGTPTKNYLFSAFRNDDFENNYFAIACYVTTDFETFSNIDGTFSKDITLDGELTMAEISANFLVHGSIANDEESFEIPSIIQINDTIFFSSGVTGTTDKHIFKIEDGVVTNELINIPDLNPLYRNPILYYNGLDILISVLCDDSGTQTKELWKVDLDLTGFAQQYVLSDFNDYNYMFLPDNLDQVNGEYAMFIDQDTNEVKLLLTDNKWQF